MKSIVGAPNVATRRTRLSALIDKYIRRRSNGTADSENIMDMDTSTNVGESYAIHMDDKDTELPAHPGPGWTRFVCISDTHSRTSYPIPSGDVLLHAGDLSSWGELSQLTKTIEWLKALDHPVKIIVAGNHDWCLDTNFAEIVASWGGDPRIIQQARAYVHSQAVFGLYYLEHEAIHFTAPTGRVWKVYGSPGSQVYGQGAFQYDSRAEAQAIYDQIPDDTEILITHTPPYMLLDETRRGAHVGCKSLAARLNNLSECRLHVFGHIHEAAGTHIAEGIRRLSINAAIERSGRAIIIDLQN